MTATTAVSFFPAPDAAGRLLTEIVGHEIKVRPSAPLDLKTPAGKIYGVYLNGAADEVCLCVIDVAFAAFAAGAMLRFPQYVIDEAIKTCCLSEGLADATREILNICGQMFHTKAHVMMRQCCLKHQELPEQATALLRAPGKRADFAASVAGSGSGRVTLLVH
jgi:hypothetical protein